MKQKDCAIDILRDMVEFYNNRNETVNQRVKSLQDLIKIYDYEMSDKVQNSLSEDEMLYHHEYINYVLGYKVYSTNQAEDNGFVSIPTAQVKINTFINY